MDDDLGGTPLFYGNFHMPSILTMTKEPQDVDLGGPGSHFQPLCFKEEINGLAAGFGRRFPQEGMRKSAPQSQHERWSLDFEFSNLLHDLKAQTYVTSRDNKNFSEDVLEIPSRMDPLGKFRVSSCLFIIFASCPLIQIHGSSRNS